MIFRSGIAGTRVVKVRVAMTAVIVASGAGLFASCSSGKFNTNPLEHANSSELERVLSRVMAQPEIRVERGFLARVLIVPGETKLYDPLFMRYHAGLVWLNDDGADRKATREVRYWPSIDRVTSLTL
jgi:hypothetical protein